MVGNNKGVRKGGGDKEKGKEGSNRMTKELKKLDSSVS